MTYLDVVKSISGLTHYYPLTTATGAKDVVGTLHGTNNGATFTDTGAVFDGTDYIELPQSQDFSATKTGGLSVVVFLTISDWRGAGASEYVHWMGKGGSNTHEWTFRHYVKGGTGEASTRQGRVSFYAFNAAGGLGAGSYYQDSTFPTTERVFIATLDRTYVAMWCNGSQRDKDPLSGYSINQTYTTAPVRIGTRDKSTGYLKGKVRRVAFYNRVLTETEMDKLYDSRSQADGAGTTEPTPAPMPTPTPSPVPTTATAVKVGNQTHRVDGVNIVRGTDDLVLYTRTATQTSSPANEWGAEAAVSGGKVVKVVDHQAGTSIPTGGYVISGHGTARDWVLRYLKLGVSVITS